jgi:hypothetical protein
MKCPYCKAKVGLYQWRGHSRVKDGSCPYCRGKVTITYSGIRFAILLPLAMGIPVIVGYFVGSNTLTTIVLPLLGMNMVFFGTIQLDKIPDA